MADELSTTEGRRRRFQEALAAVLRAFEEGRTADPEVLIAAYPTDLAAELRECFADRAFLERIDPRPEGAAPAAPPTPERSREPSATTSADTQDLMTFVPSAGAGVPPPPGRRLG